MRLVEAGACHALAVVNRAFARHREFAARRRAHAKCADMPQHSPVLRPGQMRGERSFAVPFLEHVDARRHMRIGGPVVSETAWLYERAFDPAACAGQRLSARLGIDIDDRLDQDLHACTSVLESCGNGRNRRSANSHLPSTRRQTSS